MHYLFRGLKEPIVGADPIVMKIPAQRDSCAGEGD